MTTGVLIAFDIIIVVLLALIYVRSNRADKSGKNADMLLLKQLQGEITGAMADSQQASQELVRAFSTHAANLTELLEKTDAKEKRLKRYILHAEELLQDVQKAVGGAQAPESPEDPYKLAAQMLQQGRPAETIQQELNLNHGEIELIQQLARRK